MATCALGSTAWAQDAETFDPAGSLWDRRGTFQLEAPTLGPENSFYAGFGLTYAKSPLVLQYPDEVVTVVGSQFSTRLAAGYTWKTVGRVDLDLPVYPSVVVDGASRAAMGDIRLGALLPIWADPRGVLAVGLQPQVRIGAGGQDAYLSNGGLGGRLNAAAGGRAGELGWTANLGVDLSRSSELAEQLTGSSLLLGGGLHYLLPADLLVGAELTSHVSLAGGLGGDHASPTEWHLYGAKSVAEDWQVDAGMGSGLVAGIGAPKMRVFLGFSWRPASAPPTDVDGDGIKSDVDGCPEVPEDKDGFEDADGCPDPDNDKDGIPDGEDACPDVPGVASTKGCPDRDGDGVADRDDACLDEPGPAATKGCPDRDGDGIPDHLDKCPDEAGKPPDGCPVRVVVTDKKIEILERVYFDTDKATIKPVSFPLLLDVARAMQEHPGIQLVEVQGHTDNTADDAHNLKLSKARAESVRQFLIDQGKVDPARLTAEGYGETRPIETNRTDDGKAANRRVEFVILKQ